MDSLIFLTSENMYGDKLSGPESIIIDTATFNDYQKFNMPKVLMFFPLIITYFVGPLGIFLYWIFRIFYAKKITLYD